MDAYQAVASSLNYALGMFHYPVVDDDTIRRSVGWGDRHLMGSFVKDEDIDRVLSVYRQHHKNALKSGTKFLTGAKELLAQLKQDNYLLTIASNRPTRFTHIILKHLRASSLFDYVLCGDKVTNPKPAGDLLVETLKKFRLTPDEMIYVGDMTIDVQTGHAANVKTIVIPTGSSTEQELKSLKPFCIIHRLDVLHDVLGELNASPTKL